jgi:hypothetical protein
MTGQEIPPEEKLAWPTLKSPQVDPITFKVDMTGNETSNLGDGDEQVAPFDFDHESDDGRMRGVTHSGDEILHPAEAVTSPIDKRALDDVGEVGNQKPMSTAGVNRHQMDGNPDTRCAPWTRSSGSSPAR